MSYTILLIISIVLLLAGIASIFLFVFPSLPFMFVIALIFGLIDHFQHLTITNLIILGGLAVLAEILDFFSGILGAKIGGASRDAIILGTLGLIVGFFTFPPFGSIIGLF